MDQDRLDKFIKDKVFDHLTPTDTDALWQGILEKHGGEEKPKRRFLGFWLLAGLLLIAGLAGYGIFGNSDTPNNAITTTQKDFNNKEYTPELNNDKEQLSNSNNINTSNSNPVQDNLKEDNNNSIGKSSNHNPNHVLTNTFTNKVHNNSSTSPQNTINNANHQTVNTPDDTTIQPYVQTKEIGTDPFAESTSMTTSPTPSPDNNDPTLSPKNTLKSPIALSLEENNHSITGITLTTLLAELGHTGIPMAIDKEKLPEVAPPPPTKPIVNKIPWSMGAHFSYGLSDRRLTSTNSEDQSAYINLRNQTETATQVLSGGLDFQYRFKSGLYAKAGLQYEQITERFDYTRNTDQPFFNPTVVDTIYYFQNGTTSTSLGAEAINRSIHRRKIYNRYRTVDLALMAGYHPHSTKRLSWFAEGGVLVNLVFLPRGEILDTNGIERIDLSENEYFRKNIGLGLVAGAGVSYQLTKDWSVWMSPKIRYSLGSMTGGDYLLEQRYWRGALEIGGRFGF